MENDSVLRQEREALVSSKKQMIVLVQESCRQLQPRARRGVGHPGKVSWQELCVGILLCVLQGWHVQLDLWRLITTGAIEPFEPVAITDQAIYNRLARAGEPMRQWYEQVSGWLALRLEPLADQRVAPFASQVLALDECSLDKVARWLPSLRTLANSDPKLLAGRLSALFDVRSQQWVRVDLLSEGKANCKLHAQQMLSGLQAGCLLLFDRGYFSFAWFDTLSQQGLWWVSRYANRASFRVVHTIYEGDGVLDAIVQLGTRRADQAQEAVRLLRFWSQGQPYCYLTNVLDPYQLSLQDVVDLYGRRWDIEMAFRLLKDYLQLNELWSAKWSVVQVEIWAGLLLAQLFHAVQMQVAHEAGVDPFEVSMELLVRWVPRLLAWGQEPVAYLVRWGREMQVIRKSARHRKEVPWIDPAWLTPPPSEVIQPRERARHSQRHCERRRKAAS
jgi:Transposase DDE domain